MARVMRYEELEAIKERLKDRAADGISVSAEAAQAMVDEIDRLWTRQDKLLDELNHTPEDRGDPAPRMRP